MSDNRTHHSKNPAINYNYRNPTVSKNLFIKAWTLPDPTPWWNQNHLF